ncbi:hypothetical protein [Clostridium estertheticum]|nr:hypothetical protein [Clostridium estertheticum]
MPNKATKMNIQHDLNKKHNKPGIVDAEGEPVNNKAIKEAKKTFR